MIRVSSEKVSQYDTISVITLQLYTKSPEMSPIEHNLDVLGLWVRKRPKHCNYFHIDQALLKKV